jgi:trimeric autotransporter adhesin
MNIHPSRIGQILILTAFVLEAFGSIFAQPPRPIRTTKTAINGPSSLALFEDRYLFVVEQGDYRSSVLRIDLKNRTITTVAGNGQNCCYKEHALATEVGFEWVNSIAVDSRGNLFIADSNYVRKVDGQTAHIVTVAGNGEGLHTTEGPSGLTTTFGAVIGLAFDSSDNLFVSDGSKIFKIESANGALSAVAGNGRTGFSGDGDLATNASFRDLRSIAIDFAGNIIAADVENCRIRRIDHATAIIDTIAVSGGIKENCPPQVGTISWQQSPDDPVIDARGNIYFDEPSVGLIAQATSIPARPRIVAGTGAQGFNGAGGAATSAQLHNPSGLAVDTAGNLFIADFVNNRIYRVDGKTRRIAIIAGNGLPHRVDTQM